MLHFKELWIQLWASWTLFCVISQIYSILLSWKLFLVKATAGAEPVTVSEHCASSCGSAIVSFLFRMCVCSWFFFANVLWIMRKMLQLEACQLASIAAEVEALWLLKLEDWETWRQHTVTPTVLRPPVAALLLCACNAAYSWFTCVLFTFGLLQLQLLALLLLLLLDMRLTLLTCYCLCLRMVKAKTCELLKQKLANTRQIFSLNLIHWPSQLTFVLTSPQFFFGIQSALEMNVGKFLRHGLVRERTEKFTTARAVLIRRLLRVSKFILRRIS